MCGRSRTSNPLQYLKLIILLQILHTPPIRPHQIPRILMLERYTNMLRHIRRIMEHRIEDNQVLSAVPAPLDADNGHGVPGVLEVDWWEGGAADAWGVVCTAVVEVAFYCVEEEGVSRFGVGLGFEALGVTAKFC